MKAFRAIRDEMRETADFISRPYSGHERRPIRRQPGTREEEDALPLGIEPWMELTFQELIRASQTGAPFVLAPCKMNGDPAAIIGFAYQHGGRTHIRPFFLACQPWMMFTAPEEDESGDGSQGQASGRAAEFTL